MNIRLFGALSAMAFCWVGSQIPLYLFGGIIPDIYSDIGGVDRWIWIPVSYLIALAAICPFTGALSDLLGRRYVAMLGSVLLILGTIVCSTAKNINIFICGMVFNGLGAGINELIALAGTGELVPTAKRGAYVGAIVFTIVPFCPSVLYAQLILKASSWRYVGILVGIWNFLALVLTIFCYWPPKRLNSDGYSRKKVLQRIDWIGGLLSISGVLLFLMGLQWSAQQYTWHSVHVLVPFILGIVLMVLFVLWEVKFAKFPMVPARLFLNKKLIILTLLITFLSGANFFALLFFWPTEAYNVYGADPIGVGIRGLPIGFGIIGGAVISLIMIGVTKGRIRFVMLFFTALMTAGTGAMVLATPRNINTMWGILTIASIGVGGVIVPCSIIATIICPDDIIATITALTLSIRVLGGAIGFTIYYNVFYRKLVPLLTEIVGIRALALQLIQFNQTLDTELVTLAANAQFAQLRNITDQWQHTPGAFNVIVGATQWAFVIPCCPYASGING